MKTILLNHQRLLLCPLLLLFAAASGPAGEPLHSWPSTYDLHLVPTNLFFGTKNFEATGLSRTGPPSNYAGYHFEPYPSDGNNPCAYYGIQPVSGSFRIVNKTGRELTGYYVAMPFISPTVHQVTTNRFTGFFFIGEDFGAIPESGPSGTVTGQTVMVSDANGEVLMGTGTIRFEFPRSGVRETR